MSDDLRAGYDGYYKYDRAVATSYDADRADEPQWWTEDRFVEEFFRQKKVARLLDVPVGTGRFFRHYAGVASVTAVDISDDMLAEARRRLPSLLSATKRVEHGDVFSLQFADREFDTVLVWRFFHLIPDDLLQPAVAELCRVTAGELLVQTYALRAATPSALTTWRKAVNKLNDWRPRLWAAFRTDAADAPAEASPWGHIRAYYRPQSAVDAAFARCGFAPSLTRALDDYPHCEVRATVYQRTL